MKLSSKERRVVKTNISCVRQGIQVLLKIHYYFYYIYYYLKWIGFTPNIGKPCALPWKYNNQNNSHNGCGDPAGNRPWKDKKWCPTEVNSNNRFYPWINGNWNNNWGYCDDICLNTSSKNLRKSKYPDIWKKIKILYIYF